MTPKTEKDRLDADVKFFSLLFNATREKRSKTKALYGNSIRSVKAEVEKSGLVGPPYDLSHMALLLGAPKIVFAPLSMRGRLVVEGKEIVIEINDQLSDIERRHTIAHELAHLILERDRISISRSAGYNTERSLSHHVMEQMCDICADEILLPEAWLTEKLTQSDASLRAVSDLAAQTELSIEYIVTRIIKLQLAAWRAIWITNSKGQYQIYRSIPVWDDSFLASVELDVNDNSPVARCMESNSIVTGRLQLRIYGDLVQYPAESIPLTNNTVFCLLHV